MKLLIKNFMVFTIIITFTNKPASHSEVIFSMLRPVKCTRTGLNCYIKHSFNHPLYAKEFMSRSFMHLIDLLTFAKNLNEPYNFIESAFSLFHERFQDARYANVYAVDELLGQLPELIGHLVPQEQIKTQAINQHMLTTFQQRFSEFKSNPHQFLQELSQEVYDLSLKDHREWELTQQMMIRFFDQILNKVIWDPYDQLETWKSYRLILDDLTLLYDYAIIPDTRTLNHLLWAITYRFGYFIECAGAELGTDTYKTIQKELESHVPESLLIEEQEELLMTKLRYLHDQLLAGSVKARAKEQGILTDTVIA